MTLLNPTSHSTGQNSNLKDVHLAGTILTKQTGLSIAAEVTELFHCSEYNSITTQGMLTIVGQKVCLQRTYIHVYICSTTYSRAEVYIS